MSTKSSRRRGSRPARGDVFLHPESLFLSQLKEQKQVKTPAVRRLSGGRLRSVVSEQIGKAVILKPPVLELSARRPFDATGYVEMYEPGRWDTSSDQVFMSPIVQGKSIGEWTGSAAYIFFTPPSTGTYIMVVHFYGYQITMQLNATGGTTTASSNLNTPAVVTALFTATVGVETAFTMACTGIFLGFLQTIQVHQI